MIKEKMDKWLDALVSEKYTQTTAWLKRKSEDDSGYQYCCLGVAAEAVFHSPTMEDDYGICRFEFNHLYETFKLPYEEASQLDLHIQLTEEEVNSLNDIHGLFLKVDDPIERQTALMRLNDRKVPFKSIGFTIRQLGWDNPSKEQLVKEWVAKLRSGEYTQTAYSLKHGNDYCCLGVYVEGVLGRKFGLCNTYESTSLLPTDFDSALIGLNNRIPMEERQSIQDKLTELGIMSDVKGHNELAYQNLLAGMNDEGASFDDIADMIEFLELEKK
jgi:hypothetical protein